MVVSDCDILKRMNYRVCVIDEAHRLKNRNCKLLTGGLLSFTIDHRILLTGTPLQNNIEELFSLLSFLEPEQFHSSSAFLEQFGQCQSEEQVQTLQEMLKPMMLRRLKEDVEKSLQPKEETIIEVQLSNTQKKYYRAILERNFSHLCKGSSVPSLMNAMMELRKCCNHPFLINGAEEQILTELKTNHPEWSEEEVYQNALVQSSGKLVLISKLLPKLRSDGHKVLIFSQMVRVLDIIEEYLVAQSYPFERIDGNVRGDLRQTAIDRFSRQDFDRFVFLLCTRAGGLGINLTAADTVIIFDSDWNPQNDLQAQARCHRIGQTKMVKVYRLITSNTYEREMFDKASLKLGLDKAVLQSTTALKDTSQQLSRKEVEELLKKGAYGAIMDENNEESKFSEEDIETILLRRTTTITLEAGVKGSTFAKASFNSSTNREDIDIDDPNFWSKWAKKANIDIESSSNEKELILLEPRNRKKRFEDNVYKAEGGDDSDGMESDESGSGRKKSDKKNERKKKKEDVEYRPDEFAFNKSEYFKIEKLLSQFGWGRWKAMREASDLKDAITEPDIEHMSRTLLLHCIREYRGDEKVREFVWRLIIPKGGEVNGKSSTKKKAGGLTSVYHEGWAALPEYNPPAFAVDSSFQRHVHRHSNKLLIRMHQLHILNTEVIGSRTEKIMKNATADEIDLPVESPPDSLVNGWDAECDKSLLIGSHKHGVDNYEAMREDENLCFVNKHLQPFPSSAELQSRFRKLLTLFQRKRNAAANNSMWTKREEMEFMRVLRSYGVKDDPNTIISWTRFRQLSPLLDKKSDGDLMEQLYCVLSMCTKQLGNEMSSADLERAVRVEPLSARKAQKLMHRMNMMRQIHDWMDSLPDRTSLLQLCSTEAMPNGWSTEHDEELFIVVESNGLDNISSNIAHRPIFQKIVRPEEKTLLRRVAEIYTTLQTKKWNGSASIGLLEDSDEETPASATSVTESQIQIRSKRGRKRMNLTSGSTTVQDLVGAEKEKMRALAHQSFLHRFEQLPFAAAAAMAQGAFLLPSLMSASSSVSQQAMLSSLFGLPTTVPSPPITPALSKTFGSSSSADDVLNLSTKNTNPSRKTSLVSSAGPNVGSLPQIAQCSSPSLNTTPSSSSSTVLNNLNFSELLALANLPPDTRVPVVNVEDGSKLTDERAPKVKNLGQWLSAHPKYVLDITTDLTSKSSVTSLPSASLPPKLNPENAVENSTTKATTPVGLDEVNTVKDSNGSTSTPKSAAPTPASEDVAAGPSSQPVSSPPLEPGEIPKSSASTSAPAPVLPLNSSSALSSSAAAAAVFAGLSEQPIAVFQRQTGALLSADKWPTLKTLQTWLNKHSDCNVHSSSVPLALTVLTKGYNDRMGGESLLSSSAAAASLSSSGTVSNVEALQMQMMLQQSLMNQSLLGLNAYNPLSSYAMLAAAAASGSAPSSIKSLISKDALNPMLASLMNSASNSSQLQQIQSLLALDPSLLLACQAAAKASASNRGVSDTSFLLPQMAGVVSSASSPTSSKQLQRKSSNRGRLNAVVEKLASSQP
ncbi:hypothetical protein AB6A40_001082 [Gnathostoma spinigerum]|uniref:Uncharacterized protein n=1 Tax=Gnathostoma spinigerum TaxID=75299 RepID=A0ABD6E3J0_9BILA